MYQRLLAAVMAVAIGLCGSTRMTGPRNGAVACWGIMYPKFCYIEGTYRVVDAEAEEASVEELQAADPEQVILRWKLLELLSE